MFSDSASGADASAVLYSLVETAKANDLEPYAYLRYVVERLPNASTLEDVEALLPWSAMLHGHVTTRRRASLDNGLSSAHSAKRPALSRRPSYAAWTV